MPGLGTVINVIGVAAAGVLGMFVGKFLNKKIQETILTSNGLVVVLIGISGALAQMVRVTDGKLSVSGSIMAVITLALGCLVGELIDIEGKLEQFGEWLKKKTGSEGEKGFVDGFVVSSLTICIGAMAIVGAIQDVLLGDISTLVSKTIIDFITIMIMTAAMGKGCIFSFIPVAIFQGLISLLAKVIEPIMTEQALSNLSLVGSIMIAAVGLNLLRDKKIRVANMLPGLVFAVAWAFLPFKLY